jgi:hypothetical protein
MMMTLCLRQGPGRGRPVGREAANDPESSRQQLARRRVCTVVIDVNIPSLDPVRNCAVSERTERGHIRTDTGQDVVYECELSPHVGEVGTIRLCDGTITEPLLETFCCDPKEEATGKCGA